MLHSFNAQDGAAYPYAGVVMDHSGNLYGTAYSAFELSPGQGGWTVTVLHTFTGRNGDGAGASAGFIRDTAGNLYGTTEMGGSSKDCGGGCGTVYKLHPLPNGRWKEAILHAFGSPGDGAYPGVGALAMDAVGNLYGTTSGYNAGTVYKLTPGKRGRWKETILHKFHAGAGGNSPEAGVVLGKSGELYGTTGYGGTGCDCGVVFKLAPGLKGRWKYTVLHRFTGYDGAAPGANLILDGKGNLYGTAKVGGPGGYGVAFEVTP